MNAEKATVIRVARLLESSDAFILEAEVRALAERLARVYPNLPPEAKADSIVLGHSISKLLQKIKVYQEKQAMKKAIPYLDRPHHKAA